MPVASAQSGAHRDCLILVSNARWPEIIIASWVTGSNFLWVPPPTQPASTHTKKSGHCMHTVLISKDWIASTVGLWSGAMITRSLLEDSLATAGFSQQIKLEGLNEARNYSWFKQFVEVNAHHCYSMRGDAWDHESWIPAVRSGRYCSNHTLHMRHSVHVVIWLNTLEVGWESGRPILKYLIIQ